MMSAAIPITRRLAGKVALITGGASGIGECTARLFVKHGAKPATAHVPPPAERKDRNDGKSFLMISDSRDASHDLWTRGLNNADIQNVVHTTISKYGKLDIMFSNTGISGEMESRIILSDNTNFKRVFNVNAYGAFLAGKHAARVMIPAKTGCIIFTASVVSVVAEGADPICICGIEACCGGTCQQLVQPKRYRLEAEDVAKAALYLGSDDSKSRSSKCSKAISSSGPSSTNRAAVVSGAGKIAQ
ncbi:Secoisolariciresinol dehydrogenase [Vitis vinifera]|uniref:Secoisolariciresinol dehydrogenase n=1 Tax=Vitis vinifera TaxID=29760 RepID=A0A438JSP1_VITVI|nr:Secoisolariciresinol dehydrogenase [Vitis vinifera]